MRKWQIRILDCISAGIRVPWYARILPRRRRFAHDVENLTGLLGYVAKPVTPPARLKARILEAIETQVNHGVSFVSTAGRKWQTLMPGIEVCQLTRSKEYRTVLLKIQAGYTLPPHPHLRTEHAMVLEGSCLSGKLRLHTGDFLLSEAGTIHAAVRALEDCTILIVAHR